MRFIFWMAIYVAIPLAMVGASMLVGLWWTPSLRYPDMGGRLFGASIVMFFFLPGFVYTGYKHSYPIGRKRYFYIVYVAPACLALIGYIYGFFVVSF